jgi:hypothetical protein
MRAFQSLAFCCALVYAVPAVSLGQSADLGDLIMKGSPQSSLLDTSGSATVINQEISGDFFIQGGKSNYSGYVDMCGNCNSHAFHVQPPIVAVYYNGADPQYAPPCRVEWSPGAPAGSAGFSTKDYFAVSISCNNALPSGVYQYHFVAVGAHN